MIDLIGPLLETFANKLNKQPVQKPSIIEGPDNSYFRRIEAIEFAVQYDDGKDMRGIKEADIVLIGVSRTLKTPLSMYLAHKMVKVANIPLVPEVSPPEELLSYQRKMLRVNDVSRETKRNKGRKIEAFRVIFGLKLCKN